MEAAVLREHGGPEAFEVDEIERPEPGEGETLVRVLACALNHLDIFVRRGMPGVTLPLPHVAGGDIVGVVEAADEGVEQDRLAGTPSERGSGEGLPSTSSLRRRTRSLSGLIRATFTATPRFRSPTARRGACSSCARASSRRRRSSSSVLRAASAWPASSSPPHVGPA